MGFALCRNRGCKHRVRTGMVRPSYSKGVDGQPLADGRYCWRCRAKQNEKKKKAVAKWREKNVRPWTMEGALWFIRGLIRRVEGAGYGLAMAGSVLLRGGSEDDLDLVAFPLDSTRPNLKGLKETLESAGLKRKFTAEEVQKQWRRKGSVDKKHVEVWYRGKQRIDLFILS